MYFLFLLFFSIFLNIWSARFVYPIGNLDQNKLLIYYQKKVNKSRLYIFDTVDKSWEDAEMGIFNPVGVSIRPLKDGFVFIDDSQIYFHNFLKRSPSRIEYKHPIYNIHPLSWIDNEHFIFSAKYKDKFQIFKCNLTKKEIERLKISKKRDLTFPCQIESDLYYLSYNRLHESHKIKINGKTVYKTNKEGLAFLKMESANQGFFINYPLSYSSKNPSLNLSYMAINKDENNNWVIKKILDFSIPTKLIIGKKTKLTESILPLIPRKHGDHLYFIEFKDNKMVLNIMNLNDLNVEKLFQDDFIISPIVINSSIYYGFSSYTDFNDEPNIKFVDTH